MPRPVFAFYSYARQASAAVLVGLILVPGSVEVVRGLDCVDHCSKHLFYEAARMGVAKNISVIYPVVNHQTTDCFGVKRNRGVPSNCSGAYVDINELPIILRKHWQVTFLTSDSGDVADESRRFPVIVNSYDKSNWFRDRVTPAPRGPIPTLTFLNVPYWTARPPEI
jgi:hypothetical protein